MEVVYERCCGLDVPKKLVVACLIVPDEQGQRHKVLVEAAQTAAHTKQTSLSAYYRRIAARRGAKTAFIAVAHTILTMIYHLLSTHQPYAEFGGNYFDERDRQVTEKRLIQRLEHLG